MKIIALGVICFAVAVAFRFDFFLQPQRGKTIEMWETTNRTFKVGVTAYAEKNGGFAPGAYYVFRSARTPSDNWQEIMTLRHDDPVPIPRNQVHFVNDEIGYVFMGWIYAVTTDAGLKWSVWSADKDLPGWQCCNYSLIQDVQVAPDGVGTMKLKPIPGRQGEVAELYSRDYGRHWLQK
jgi:photosystem II stability/assembly factor-like uncharacterized protein